MVAGSEVADRGADLLDDAGAFVAAHDRVRQVREIAVAGMQVGLAHPARDDPYQQLVRPRIRQVQLFDAEASRSFARDGRNDLHEPPSRKSDARHQRAPIDERTYLENGYSKSPSFRSFG
jgi:hypothetical protein